MSRLFTLSAVLAATLTIAACGGSGAEPPAAAPTPPSSGNDVPASATASPEAFVGWSAMQPASETREPWKVEGMTPPTSETAEPVTIG